MHFFILLYFGLHPCSDTSAIPFSWGKTKNWKIYSLNNSRTVFSIPADSVRPLNGSALGDDSMRLMLSRAKLLHVPSSPAWMGCYLTSCENEQGQLVKVVVSQYGGFFLNDYDGNYYQLDGVESRVWLNYMRRAYIKTE